MPPYQRPTPLTFDEWTTWRFVAMKDPEDQPEKVRVVKSAFKAGNFGTV